MTDSSDFVTYVITHLSPLGAVQTRPIFGGVGILVEHRLVGVVLHDLLYLYTDEHSRLDYLAHGMGPLRPYPNAFNLTTDQYQCPEEIVRDPAKLEEWARRALQASVTSARTKQLAGIERSRKAKAAKRKSAGDQSKQDKGDGEDA